MTCTCRAPLQARTPVLANASRPMRCSPACQARHVAWQTSRLRYERSSSPANAPGAIKEVDVYDYSPGVPVKRILDRNGVRTLNQQGSGRRGQLARALADVYIVKRISSDAFLLTSSDLNQGRSVVLVAEEGAVSARMQSLRGDALRALGAVKNDETGSIAAAGLLAIHVEEAVEKHPSALAIVITPTDLRVEETGGTE